LARLFGPKYLLLYTKFSAFAFAFALLLPLVPLLWSAPSFSLLIDLATRQLNPYHPRQSIKTMRFLTLCAAFAATVLAQDLTQLPSCATSCVGNSLSSTGCGSLNVTCICNSAGWISGLTCCISKGCDQADINSTIKFAQQICQPVGVTLPSVAVCSNSTAKTSAITTSASKTSSATAGSTAGAAPTGPMLGFGAGIAAAAGLLAAAL